VSRHRRGGHGGAVLAAAPQTPGRPVVAVTTRGGPFPGVSAAVMRRRAEKMLDHLGLGGVELSVALVDDGAIRELNRVYRHKDKPTDVLAFPLQEPVPAAPVGRSTMGAPPPDPRSGLLGDVILSVETGRRQAARHRRPLLGELTMLLAHGLLHLLGHDHQTDAQERAMTARTRELETAAVARRPGGRGISP
jgi:probable rRNA maturation factor